MRIPLLAAVLLPPLAMASTAAAEPLSTTTSTTPVAYEVGVRIGGYGFRRDGAQDPDEARSDGS